MAEEIERIYVIPLKKNGMKSSGAAPSAVKRVKQFLTRHMKVEENNIWIDDSLNTALWSRGRYNIPNKIRVKAVKFDDGIVEAYLPELGFKKSRRELLKEEREKKEPILKKEEPEAEGEPGEVAGTEDYEIAPTGDGEVKIKKKKTPKEKKEKETKPTEEKPEKKPTKEKPAKPVKKSTKPKTQKKSPTKKKTAKKTTKRETTKKTASKSTTAKKKVISKKKSG
jgi:large subunit ribosomal protein L31e